jgi:hypothetical protein
LSQRLPVKPEPAEVPRERHGRNPGHSRPGGCQLFEGDTIMAKGMTSTELLAIYEALDESRKQELVDHALELIEEQRDERRTEQRI